LEQTRDHGHRVGAEQYVNVRAYHPDLENERPFLARDDAEKPIQEASEAGIEQRGAIAGGPDDVHVKAVAHPPNLSHAVRILASNPRRCRATLRDQRGRSGPAGASELALKYKRLGTDP